jgi:hypothetical protein
MLVNLDLFPTSAGPQPKDRRGDALAAVGHANFRRI